MAYLTEDEIALHAEVFSRTQHLVTDGTAEAVEMIDTVPRAHHQLLRRDAHLTARTRLHRKLPGTESVRNNFVLVSFDRFSIRWCYLLTITISTRHTLPLIKNDTCGVIY